MVCVRANVSTRIQDPLHIWLVEQAILDCQLNDVAETLERDNYDKE